MSGEEWLPVGVRSKSVCICDMCESGRDRVRLAPDGGRHRAEARADAEQVAA